MNEKVRRMLEFDARLEAISEEMHRLARERNCAVAERLEVRLTLNYDESQTYHAALMARVARPVDAISAVRARGKTMEWEDTR